MSETTKERKLREKAEAEANKEAAKEDTPLEVVPAEQTDGADTINERPQSDSVEEA